MSELVKGGCCSVGQCCMLIKVLSGIAEVE